MRLNNSSGYILLATAIVLSSIALLAAISVLYFSIGFTKNNRTFERSNQAKGLANACAELALQKLIVAPTFVGSVNNTIAPGTCSYTITNPTSGTILVSAVGQVTTVIRKVQISINLSPSAVGKWQEMP